jgi:DNA-binding GntR family transcriptional regulator
MKVRFMQVPAVISSGELKIDLTSGEPLSRQVLRELRTAIVTMRLLPGQVLSEQDIATQVGISRAPVREALINLRDAGLIRVMPQRGTLVLKISAAAIEGVRFIREAIERAVAREAAHQATPAGLERLRASLDEQRGATVAAAFFALDDSFHGLLAEVARRPEAWRLIEDVKPQMDRVRYLSMADPVPRETIIAHHEAILEAVAAKDGAAADAAMGVHLSAIIHSLPRLAARYADLFDPA